jgi:hypothetical protein
MTSAEQKEVTIVFVTYTISTWAPLLICQNDDLIWNNVPPIKSKKQKK